MLACTPASTRRISATARSFSSSSRKNARCAMPADKVIAPVLLDNPVLSHVGIIQKLGYCINFTVSISSDPSFSDKSVFGGISVKRKELTWDDEKLLGLMLAA